MNSKSLFITVLFIIFIVGAALFAGPDGTAGRPAAASAPGGDAGASLVYMSIMGQMCPLAGPPAADWLAYVNSYRSMSGLPALTSNLMWGCGNALHGRYMVKNDIQEHDEDPGNSWYTPEGQLAAQSSNLFASSSVGASDYEAIDGWMQAVFHAVGIIDPELAVVGYGSYREADGGLQMGAGLDVIRGLASLPPGTTFPILWPGDGATVSLTLHWGEIPSPLTSCPGYSLPSGLPLFMQIGAGSETPAVTASSFKQDTTELDHCIFDETDYSNPDAGEEALGRAILDARDAVVLIPRDPLTPGATYTASITEDGQTHTWSFSVATAVK